MNDAALRHRTSFTAWVLRLSLTPLLFVPDAALAGAPGEPSPPVSALLDCRGMAEGTGRLACFDAAVARLDRAIRDGEISVTARAVKRAEEREGFGLSGAQREKTAPPAAPAPVSKGEKTQAERQAPREEARLDSVTAKVLSATRNGSGDWVVTLEKEGSWEQTDGVPLGRFPRAGSTAIIQRAAFGSFKMQVDGGPWFRVRRLR